MGLFLPTALTTNISISVSNSPVYSQLYHDSLYSIDFKLIRAKDENIQP